MFVGKNIVYLDLQKTGSTQITKVLKSIPSEKGIKFKKHITFHQLPIENREGWGGKVKLGSIRNPWSWYVSLWAYGCEGKGALYKNNTQFSWKQFKDSRSLSYLFQPRKEWQKIYSDVQSKENFKTWLSLILHDNKQHFLDYGRSPISKIVGIYTFRYLRLYIKEFLKIQFELNPEKKSIIELDHYHNVLDFTIRQEHLKDDLIAFLQQQHLPISEKTATLLEGRTNSSKHLHYQVYYDEESIEWIREKEWFIINKYNYSYD